MSSLETAGGGRALVYEVDALTAERVRQQLAGEGFATCTVDDWSLFHELRSRVEFDLFLVGVRGREPVEALTLCAALTPLILLAPLSGRARSAQYRLTLPGALLVDRNLRAPDALRAALRLDAPKEESYDPADPVRQAFAEFGLSERQLEVLSGALRGESSKAIARKLFISEPTVRNHLHAIYERVGVSGRRELLGRFVQGMIEAHA